MDKSKNILMNEKYMYDAPSSILSDLAKLSQRRYETSVWGYDINVKKTYDYLQREQIKKFEDSSSVKADSSPVKKMPQTAKNELLPDLIKCKDDRRPPKSLPHREYLGNIETMNDRTLVKKVVMKKETMIHEIECAKSEGFKENKTEKINKNGFEVWCNKRKEESKSRTRPSSQPKNHRIVEMHFRSNNDISTKKRNRSKSKTDSDARQKKIVIPNKNSKSMNEFSTGKSTMKDQVSVKIIDEIHDKSQEFTVDLTDLLRMKRNFPKLNNIFPDVDSGNKTVEYCIDAVNIVLRFVFFRQYNFDVMPNATVAVEVLAASKSWEIKEFHHIFHKDFLQKVLPSSNVRSVFSQASYLDLNDICDACKKMATDSISHNNSTYKRKQKVCIINVSAYVEPLEFCIPFHKMEQIFAISFERHILNTIRFQALSGSFTIIGISIQLNDDHLERNNNSSMLQIDYNIKNVTEDQEIATGREEKPLRPTNIFHFKTPLIVNHNQIGEITVETDTKPYLCSAFPEEMKMKNSVNGGEFSLTVTSDFKVPKSNKKLFIVGKLIYRMLE